MSRPPITAKGEGLFRRQLTAALDYLESLGGGGGGPVDIADVTGLTAALDAKQDDLVSGTNIKTINGASVLGSGDLTVSGGASPIIGWVI